MAANLLFFPDIHLPIPQAKPSPALTDAKFKPLVQKLRLNYQKSLVILIKGADKMAGLKALLSVLAHLQQVSGTLPIAKIWWILSGLVEAIAQKGLPLNAATIGVLKQADALLSSLVSHGIRGLHIIPPQKYVHSLLHYAAYAKSNGARIKLVKHAFALQYSLPNEKLLQTTLQVFAGPDIELMRIVVTIMREDFVLIEENLDIFMRADNPDVSDLVPLVDIMTTAAYVLLLLGMEVQSASLLKQSQIIKAISQEKQAFSLASMLDIANDLLKIMAALDILANRGTHARQRIQQEEGLLETQINDVLKVVVDEAKTELNDIVQAAAALMDKSEVDEDMLNGIPRNFAKIQGLLAILSQTRASKLLHQFESYMLKHIIETQKAPAEQHHRKALAEALISIEFYLDTLAGNPMDGNQILHITQQCLKVLYTPAKAV
jgi:chemosensory pili system protein ChpA (sensor histidine kinase/response regulator)